MQSSSPRKRFLTFGEPAPWFVGRTSGNPEFLFHSMAGRYVVLCFFQSAAKEQSREVLDAIMATRELFDDVTYCFFGVSTDRDDERLGRVQDTLPGVRFFWDGDQGISRQYGAIDEHGSYQRFCIVLDPRLRVLRVFPFSGRPQENVRQVLEFLRSQPPIADPTTAAVQAPVLVVPRVFEPELCETLIRYYEEHGGEESGFMRNVDGKTVRGFDHSFKRRRDQEIFDEQIRQACMHRIHDRLVPEIHKAFQFMATRMERYIVACYDGSEGGHFRAHRDNTTKGTAHRRFAVSLNLNTGQYEGGQLSFPEFGRQMYQAPAGGAVVFSCSLLHAAFPVTRGRRYVFLPFLYDDAAARIREANRPFVEQTKSVQ